jgi:hypothetical protein
MPNDRVAMCRRSQRQEQCRLAAIRLHLPGLGFISDRQTAAALFAPAAVTIFQWLRDYSRPRRMGGRPALDLDGDP